MSQPLNVHGGEWPIYFRARRHRIPPRVRRHALAVLLRRVGAEVIAQRGWQGRCVQARGGNTAPARSDAERMTQPTPSVTAG